MRSSTVDEIHLIEWRMWEDSKPNCGNGTEWSIAPDGLMCRSTVPSTIGNLAGSYATSHKTSN